MIRILTIFTSIFVLFFAVNYDQAAYAQEISEPAQEITALSVQEPKSSVALTDYGYASTIRLTGTQAEQSLGIPDDVVAPVQSIQFSITSSPNISSGYLELLVDGQLVATWSQSELDQATILTAVFPKLLTESTQTRVVTFRSVVEESNRQVCDAITSNWREIQDVSFQVETIDGTIQTIRDFWTPALQSLYLDMPFENNIHMHQAAVELALAAERTTFGQELQLHLNSSDTATSAAAVNYASRRVRLENSPNKQAEMQLQEGTLVISGPAERLPAFIRNVLRSENQDILLSDTIRETETTDTSEPTEVFDRERTLASLGWAPQTATATRGIVQEFTLSQSAFARTVQQGEILVSGSLSQIPTDLSATVNLFWNDQLVDSLNSGNESETEFSLQATLPTERWQRDNQVRLQVEYSGEQGQCRDLHPVTFSIDTESSYIRVEPISQYIPHFDRYPQILFPQAELIVNSMDETNFAVALQVSTMLQRLSPHLLHIQLSTLQEASQSPLPKIVVSNDDTIISKLGLESTLTQYTSNQLLSGRYALAHAFVWSQQPTLLILSSNWETGHAQMLHRLQQELGWYTLNQDLLIYSDTQKYGQILVGDNVPVAYTTQEDTPTSLWEWGSNQDWFIAGGAVALLVMVVGFVLRRFLKTRANTKLQKTETQST